VRYHFKTPSKNLFAELKWETFPERVIYQTALVMYNIVNKICPDYLKYHTTYTSEICNRDTISNNSVQLYITKPNCEFFRKSYGIWNMETASSWLILHLCVCSLYFYVEV